MKWSVVEKAFTFSFSHIGRESCGHQHEMIKKVLQNEFSKHYNLPYVIQVDCNRDDFDFLCFKENMKAD